METRAKKKESLKTAVNKQVTAINLTKTPNMKCPIRRDIQHKKLFIMRFLATHIYKSEWIEDTKDEKVLFDRLTKIVHGCGVPPNEPKSSDCGRKTRSQTSPASKAKTPAPSIRIGARIESRAKDAKRPKHTIAKHSPPGHLKNLSRLAAKHTRATSANDSSLHGKVTYNVTTCDKTNGDKQMMSGKFHVNVAKQLSCHSHYSRFSQSCRQCCYDELRTVQLCEGIRPGCLP